METALDVLMRAASMVQDNSAESRLSTKELPTTKWRRDHRQRITEYQMHDGGTGLNQLNQDLMDSPIDMSVSSNSSRHHSLISPPYRESLQCSNVTASRPSVITQAPPKRGYQECSSIYNNEIKRKSPDIDEHFRRSLGEKYAVIFGDKSPKSNSSSPPPQPVSGISANPIPFAPGDRTNSEDIVQFDCSPLSLTLAKPIAIELDEMDKLGPIKYIPQNSDVFYGNLPPPQEEPLSLQRATTLASFSPPPLAKPDSPHHILSISSTTPPTIMPAILRIRAEPGVTENANTPPASPTSPNRFITANSDIVASVDDHFAKALGDTWKKLQGNKDIGK